MTLLKVRSPGGFSGGLSSVTLFKRADSPNWIVEFQYLGQTVRRSSKTPSRTTAKALEERWRREIQERVASGKLPTIPFGEAIDRYFDTILAPRAKPGKDKVRDKDLYILDKLCLVPLNF
jgi:hypothetical protein